MKQDCLSSGTLLHNHLLINCGSKQLIRGEDVKCFIVYTLRLYRVCPCLSLWACETADTGLAPLSVIYGK